MFSKGFWLTEQSNLADIGANKKHRYGCVTAAKMLQDFARHYLLRSAGFHTRPTAEESIARVFSVSSLQHLADARWYDPIPCSNQKIDAMSASAAALDQFKRQYREAGYFVLRGAVPPESMRTLHDYALMQRQHPGYYNTEPITSSLDRYADVMAESLLLELQQPIEAGTGKQLFPSYSWLRIYYPGSELPKHIDRKSCEVSASITVGFDADEQWPLFVHSQGKDIAIDLSPGDLLVYDGSDVPHWRETFKGRYWIQIFLHYVDRAGEQTAYRFDGRPAIGAPKVRKTARSKGRNKPCHCGSGRKFKHCHGRLGA